MIYELVRKADPTITTADLVAMPTGDVPKALRRGLRVRGIATDIADRWAALVQARHNIIHAHPATDRMHGQRLHRWLPGRADFVSDEDLIGFIGEVELLNRDANDLRSMLIAIGDQARPVDMHPCCD